MRPLRFGCRHSKPFAVVVAGLLSVALLLAPTSATLATGISAEEYEIKAAFLYNFAKFIEWPENAVPDAGDTFIIGIMGNDPFGAVLDEIAQTQTLGNKPIVIKRFQSLQDYTPCHILFVTLPTPEARIAVLEALRDSAVLIVGEAEGFAHQGAALNFIIQDNKVRFEVNPAAAQRAGLHISSKLLRLAIIVDEAQLKDRACQSRLAHAG